MKMVVTLLCVFLAGCASAPPPPAPPPDLFDDRAFHAPAEPVTAAHLFALSPDMQAYLQSRGFSERMHEKGPVRGLLDALYDKGALKLEYESSITRDAAQTYAQRQGNCLSLVIMTAAFAKALGIEVNFQSVRLEGSWSRAGSMYLMSNHVNMTLGQRLVDMGGRPSLEQFTTVDFLPSPDAARWRTTPLKEADIVTLYMNNRAAELLVDGRLDDAYWWARAAVARPGAPSIAYNTLAMVYRRHGDSVRSERVLRAALERDPDNLVAMENLVPVLAANGKATESAALAARVARLDPDPPFRDFDEGMRALHRGEYAQAKALFQREADRAPYNDEFHFWLAVACIELGEQAAAHKALERALETSVRADTRERYSAKLTHLRSLVPQPR